MNDFAGNADAIAKKLVAEGMDPRQAMTMALGTGRQPSGSLALRPTQNMAVLGKSMTPPGLPESVVSDTVGIIKNMDDASVIATASRITGLPFDSPIQARLMLEKMFAGGASMSAGVSGTGSELPQRLTGYEVGARVPALGGQVGVEATIPRGQGSPAINLNYRRQFQEGGTVLASDTDKIAEQLIAGGVDPQQAMTLALRMAQSRQQADQSILGGVPTQPPVSDVPPATEILGGDPSKLFQRQPTTMERIKDLPKDVLGAADAMASMGSLAALAVPSMMYALRPGQKAQGDPMEFALRNMYMPRSERGPSHLAGFGDVLGAVPQTGPLPELQAFTGLGRGVGRQLSEKGRQAGRAMAPKAADIAEDILSRQGLLMQAAPSGPTRVEAPASSLGFYDPVHQAALNIQRKQGPGQAFLNELQRSENVNKEFLEASGLAEKLRATPNITREEVQALARGSVPEIQEVVYGNTSPEATQLRRQIGELRDNLIAAKEDFQNSGYLFREIRGNDMINALPEKWQFQYDRIANMQRQYDKLVDQEVNLASAQPTKYANYQLPGGENYREVLLTIPIDREKYARSLIDPAVWSRMSEEQRAEFMNAPIRGGAAGTFKSTHWEEPNVVSHIRMNDRTDADGKRVLFIEEMQSDWAQEGRKKGFSDPKIKPVTSKQYDAFVDSLFDEYINQAVSRGEDRQAAGRTALHMRFEDLAKTLDKESEYQRMRAGRDLDMSGEELVPSAPFVQNTKEWVDLSLKNIIKRAVDEGYDRVAFVNGTQSKDRYRMSNTVDNIEVAGRTDAKTGEKSKQIFITMLDGKSVKLGVDANGVIDNVSGQLPGGKILGKPLSEVVGKDLADNLMAAPSGSQIAGEGLNVGGEGMKAFYDKLVPERVNAILKRFGGGKATTVSIEGQTKPLNVFEFRRYDQYEQAVKEQKDKKAPTMQQIGFDITPAMRERFQKPIPYKQGGSVNHKAVESARRALEKAMAKGGQVKMAGGGSVIGKAAAAAAKQAKTVLSPAESEANKAKFLADSAVQQRMYTGTSKDQDFTKFNVPKNGAWFTPSTDVASAYAKENDSKNIKYDVDTRQYKEVNTADRVMPVYLRTTKPYQITDDDIKRMNVGNYKKAQSQFFDSLRSQGHDSAIFDDGTTVILQSPHQIKSAIGNRGTYDITSPELSKAHGGLAHMSGGGSMLGRAAKAGAKAAKAAKSDEEKTLPMMLQRAPAKTKQELQQEAERVGRQIMGEHVTKPGDTANLADYSKKVSERLRAMQEGQDYVLKETTPTSPLANVNPAVGSILVGLPGDISIADKKLMSLGKLKIGSQQQGGSLYGVPFMNDPEELAKFWASNYGPANSFQRKVTALGGIYPEQDVLGAYMSMGRDGMNFAQHFADANLKAIRSAIKAGDVSKDDIDSFNKMIREGWSKINKKTGEREYFKYPDFAGIEKTGEAYAQMMLDSDLRKWFNDRMKTGKETASRGLPSGVDIEYAISEPALRNLEHSLVGYSVGKMQPGRGLISPVDHATYSHGIPGQAIGRLAGHVPARLAFSDASKVIAETKRPQDFTGTIQKVFPHQVVDQQWQDEVGQYLEYLKRVTGKKKGGQVKMAKGGALAKAAATAGKRADKSSKKPDLPQQVLSSEESAENLKRFLDESKVRERLYHATPKDFKEFKPGGEDPTLSGPAIWLSTDPKNQPAMHNISAGRAGEFREGTNVMPVYAQAKNPLVLDDPGMIDWAQAVFTGGSREFPELIAPKWAEEIRKEGYDSILFLDPRRTGQTHEVIMFEPKKIKSAIGNRGTYDTREADITKRKGGLAALRK